ncbi:hypothetical protein BDR26DRAFT_862330 [Obelidium mucronatum]|nr:hypothetical protein BDR26DRAFT_862330 [Obelidium mucronatum]
MTLKWAVLGTGFIANKVLNAGMRRAGHVLHAVGSRDLAKAREFAERNGIAKAYGSYAEAVTDADVDAVYIALPSAHHVEWALAAAAAGKHVLCEKPVAFAAADVRAVVDACASAGVVFLDGTFFKHHPRTEALRAVVASGALGAVNSVNAHFSFLMASEFAADRDAALAQVRLNPAAEPTGVLGDMAWYTVRFALMAYNYELPSEVSCTIVRRNEFTGAPEQVIGHLLFAGGRNAIFEASFSQISIQRCCITGDKGAVAIDDTFLASTFYPITQESSLAYVAPATDSFQVCKKRGEWIQHDIDTGGKLQEEWMVTHFKECVDGKRDWKVWAAETIAIHTVLDQLWASANSN